MLRAVLLTLFALSANALALAGAGSALRVAAPAVRAGPALMQFGGSKKKLTPAEKLEAAGYWPGEWVCADCGYIYEPGTEPPFEELRQKWKCPQCAGPRRRFVKKAGGMVGKVDDSPLLIGTAAFAVVIIGLVYVGLTV